MKRMSQVFCNALMLCALLVALTGQIVSATMPFTAFSVLVTENDGRTGIAGAAIQVGTVSKTTNANGFAALNMYFDGGDQTGTVSKGGYTPANITVGANSEGQTIRVKLARK